MIKAVLFDFDGVLTTDATGSQSIMNYIGSNSNVDIDKFKREYYKYNYDLLYGLTTNLRADECVFIDNQEKNIG